MSQIISKKKIGSCWVSNVVHGSMSKLPGPTCEVMCETYVKHLRHIFAAVFPDEVYKLVCLLNLM